MTAFILLLRKQTVKCAGSDNCPWQVLLSTLPVPGLWLWRVCSLPHAARHRYICFDYIQSRNSIGVVLSGDHWFWKANMMPVLKGTVRKASLVFPAEQTLPNSFCNMHYTMIATRHSLSIIFFFTLLRRHLCLIFLCIFTYGH